VDRSYKHAVLCTLPEHNRSDLQFPVCVHLIVCRHFTSCNINSEAEFKHTVAMTTPLEKDLLLSVFEVCMETHYRSRCCLVTWLQKAPKCLPLLPVHLHRITPSMKHNLLNVSHIIYERTISFKLVTVSRPGLGDVWYLSGVWYKDQLQFGYHHHHRQHRIYCKNWVCTI
jgi:hypothetical protein